MTWQPLSWCGESDCTIPSSGSPGKKIRPNVTTAASKPARAVHSSTRLETLLLLAPMSEERPGGPVVTDAVHAPIRADVLTPHSIDARMDRTGLERTGSPAHGRTPSALVCAQRTLAPAVSGPATRLSKSRKSLPTANPPVRLAVRRARFYAVGSSCLQDPTTNGAAGGDSADADSSPSAKIWYRRSLEISNSAATDAAVRVSIASRIADAWARRNCSSRRRMFAAAILSACARTMGSSILSAASCTRRMV